MGIFDSFFKGPELTKDDALNMSTSMALNLYRDGYSIEQFIQNADMLLEEIFKMEFPHHSISTEQSKQILKNVVRIYTEEKEHLKNLNKLSIYINNPTPENKPTEKVVTPGHIRGWFGLFKD
tara:strand:- start:119 stop:484 length:366 start_codon:yes stop_codon:yes gene_type:complete